MTTIGDPRQTFEEECVNECGLAAAVSSLAGEPGGANRSAFARAEARELLPGAVCGC